MGQIDRAGTFRGSMIAQAIGLSKNGHIQLEVDLKAKELYDQETQQWLDWSKYEETDIHGYLYLASKDGDAYKTAEQLKKSLGWSGETFSELDDADYSGVTIQFRVTQEVYEGKPQFKIAWIDHADATPGSSVKKLDKAEVKALDAKFAKALKTLSGGAKPKTVPAGKPVPPKTTGDSDPVVAGSTPPKTSKPKGKPTAPKVAPKSPSKGPAPFDLDKEPVNDAPVSGLPAACANADEAWAQVEANVGPDVPAAQVEETWLKAVEDMGGPDAIESEKNWAGVRDIVLETLKA